MLLCTRQKNMKACNILIGSQFEGDKVTKATLFEHMLLSE
jgi:hypothetical protein